MKICLVRLDERLIHGQVAIAWTRVTGADQLIVISDEAANDEMQKVLLEMAVPSGTKLLILTVKEAVDKFKQEQIPGTKVILVFKKPEDILKMVQEGVDIPVLNIGGMYYRPERKQYRKALCLSEEDIQILNKLYALGVKLEYQVAPMNNKEDVLNIIKAK